MFIQYDLLYILCFYGYVDIEKKKHKDTFSVWEFQVQQFPVYACQSHFTKMHCQEFS